VGFFMMDVIFNIFALCAGVFLFANSLFRFSCHFMPMEFNTFVYMLMFSLIASSIRFKSILHSFTEARVQIYEWLMAQRWWINAESPSSIFCQVRNSFTLLHYNNHHNIFHMLNKPKEKISVLSALLIFLGIAMMVGFAVTMWVIFPHYKGGDQVGDIKTWNSVPCNIANRYTVYGTVGKYLYVYTVYMDGYESTLAIPIGRRFADPFNDDVDDADKPYINATTSDVFQCHTPSMPISVGSEAYLDYKREGSFWKYVTILGSNEDLDTYEVMYYLWAILPSVMMALGLGLLIGGIVVAVRSWKKKKGSKNSDISPLMHTTEDNE